ncbi:hypothetical protein PG984_016231 [Apiospora sp. TS-2023a]
MALASLLRSVEKQRHAYGRCRARAKVEGHEGHDLFRDEEGRVCWIEDAGQRVYLDKPEPMEFEEQEMERAEVSLETETLIQNVILPHIKSALGTGRPPFTPTNKTGSALLPATVAAAVQEIVSAVVEASADKQSQLLLETQQIGGFRDQLSMPQRKHFISHCAANNREPDLKRHVLLTSAPPSSVLFKSAHKIPNTKKRSTRVALTLSLSRPVGRPCHPTPSKTEL